MAGAALRRRPDRRYGEVDIHHRRARRASVFAQLRRIARAARKTVDCDIHCVTTWSRLDNTFEGVPVQGLLERAGLKPAARYCLVVAEQGFTTNLPLADLNRPRISSR